MTGRAINKLVLNKLSLFSFLQTSERPSALLKKKKVAHLFFFTRVKRSFAQRDLVPRTKTFLRKINGFLGNFTTLSWVGKLAAVAFFCIFRSFVILRFLRMSSDFFRPKMTFFRNEPVANRDLDFANSRGFSGRVLDVSNRGVKRFVVARIVGSRVR